MQPPSPRSAFVAALIATSTMALAASAPAEAAEREATRAAVATAGGQIGPIVIYPVKHDLSPPLREIARTLKPAPAEAGEREVEEQIINFWAPIISPAVPDPVVQDWYGDGTMPDPEFSFEGNRNSENAGAVSPPDTNGDIGPNHYLHSVNLIFSVYNRAGSRVLGPLPTNAIWAGFGGLCQTTNSGDPIALYDHMADRWLLSQFTPPGTPPFHQCIAISQTGDPTGAWHRYDFQLPSTVFNDYPKFGVWPDAYYMSASGRGIPGPPTDIYAFERPQMLTGGTARLVFFRTDASLGYVTPLPADLDGPPPPAGAPEPFVGVKQSVPQALYVFRFHVDWTNPANSTFGINGLPNDTLTSVAPFTLICPTTRDCVRQPPPATIGLDALAGRYVMYRPQYRNFGTHESIVFNHTVDAGATRAGVRWYEIRDPNGTPVLHQQGTYAPADGVNRWMGSAAMDKFGNLAIGYSVSSTTVFPGIRYAGRLASDPLGELTQGEAELIAGAGVQTEHRQPLGRLQHDGGGSDRRLHVLVHDRVLRHDVEHGVADPRGPIPLPGLRDDRLHGQRQPGHPEHPRRRIGHDIRDGAVPQRLQQPGQPVLLRGGLRRPLLVQPRRRDAAGERFRQHHADDYHPARLAAGPPSSDRARRERGRGAHHDGDRDP